MLLGQYDPHEIMGVTHAVMNGVNNPSVGVLYNFDLENKKCIGQSCVKGKVLLKNCSFHQILLAMPFFGQ